MHFELICLKSTEYESKFFFFFLLWIVSFSSTVFFPTELHLLLC